MHRQRPPHDAFQTRYRIDFDITYLLEVKRTKPQIFCAFLIVDAKVFFFPFLHKFRDRATAEPKIAANPSKYGFVFGDRIHSY